MSPALSIPGNPLQYCERHHVELRAEKTKLQAFSNKNSELQEYYAKIVSPIKLGSDRLQFVTKTEHVGIIRSSKGNMDHITGRLSAHVRALSAVLPVGLAKRHRGNPAAALRVHNIYATPVLFLGLASLVLNRSEISLLDHHLKTTAQQLQKLMKRTPQCIVCFLGGLLPGTAVLHLRQLTLFGMVTRMKNSIIYHHGLHTLISAKPSAGSWFQQIRNLCVQYNLPHPISLLKEPLTKYQYNRLVKASVTDHWEAKLRGLASELTSAPFFRPAFMSLTHPHPLWSACSSNPYECHKAVITARMLSGRYLTDQLQRHWSGNIDGHCLLPNCSPPGTLGSLEHLLLHCPVLRETRAKLLNLCTRISNKNHVVADIVSSVFSGRDSHQIMQLLLDCSTMPVVISAVQTFGIDIRDTILYLGRTWCYNIHRERMNQLGLLDFR